MCYSGLYGQLLETRVKNLDFGGILTEVPAPNVMRKCTVNTQDLLSVW